MDSAELIKLQVALEQLAIAQEGDQEFVKFFTGLVIAASTNSLQAEVFSPPKEDIDTEFIPQLIVIIDTAAIDSLDRVQMQYQDVVTNISIPFFSSRASSLSGVSTGNQWSWPSELAEQALATSDIMVDQVPFRLFRRVNGEAWRRLLFDFSTTATVGNRSLSGYIVYRRRPTTRI